MDLMCKTVKHGSNTTRVLIPAELTYKLGWRKEQMFRISLYMDKWIVLEPIDPVEIAKPIAELENKREFPTFIKPNTKFKRFSFYIPKAIARRLDLAFQVLLTIHETGTKTIFMEVLPIGAEER